MKRIVHILFVLLYLCAYPLMASDAHSSCYQDSILRIAKTLPATSVRLAYLRDIAYKHQYAPYNMIFATRLYTEAHQQNNVFYKNQGAYYLAACYDSKHNPDSLAYWVDILKSYVPQVGTYDYYLEQKAAISRALASKRQIEKAVYVAKEALEESEQHHSNNGLIAAYNSLGCAYSVSSRANEALEVYLMAYNSFSSQTKTSLKVDILSRIAQVYGNAGSDSLKLPYLNEMKATLQDAISKEPETRKNWTNFEIDCEVKYVMYFLNKKSFVEAQEHINNMKLLLDSHVDPVSWLNVQLIQLQYYGRTNEYDKSIALIDEVTPIVLNNYVTTFATLISYKAGKQYEKGDVDGAIATLRYLIFKQDSLDNAFSTNQLQQVKEIYHIDDLLSEKQKIQDTNYRRGFVILVVILILMLIFYLYTHYLTRKIEIAEKLTAESALQAESENRAKERLKSEISHDIRTPMNVVVGFAELLAESKDMDQSTKMEYGQMIQANAENLLEYINSILELSRLESGKIQYARTECDAIILCNQVVDTVNGAQPSDVLVTLQTDIKTQRIETDKNWFDALLTSLLTPIENDAEQYQTIVRVRHDRNKPVLCFDVVNSPLAKVRFENKTSLIRHEINAHFIHYFGGIYKVQAEAAEGPTISFTIPL